MTLPDLAPALFVTWGVVFVTLLVALIVREARAAARDLDRAFRDHLASRSRDGES